MPTAKTAAESKFALRRIVVAMDSSLHSQAAAEAAVELAARFKAALEGLFVEDVNLINLADHPLCRLVSFPTAEARAPDPVALQRYIRGECARAQRTLESMAARMQLRPGFRILRGRVESEIVTAASGADLLVVGVAGRGGQARAHPGSVALAAVERATRSVLVYRSGVSAGGAPLVCFDGSDGAIKVLDAAVSLQRDSKREMRIVLMPRERSDLETLRETIDRLSSEHGLETHLIECVPPTAQRLCQLAGRPGVSGVVIGANNPVLKEGGLKQLLAGAPCPILLVR